MNSYKYTIHTACRRCEGIIIEILLQLRMLRDHALRCSSHIKGDDASKVFSDTTFQGFRTWPTDDPRDLCRSPSASGERSA